MSDLQEYRRKYNDPRIDEAYRMFVDGKMPLRQLGRIAGVSTRTLGRHSSRDKWAEEQAEREKYVANGLAMSAMSAFLSTDGASSLEARIAEALASPEVQTRMAGVLTQQRVFFDELMRDARGLLAQVKDDAKKRGGKIAVGQLLVVVGMGEKIAQQQRKAHGIPDLTKLEVDDKSAARLHAEAIGKRRQARLATAITVEADAIPGGEDGIGQHGPM